MPASTIPRARSKPASASKAAISCTSIASSGRCRTAGPENSSSRQRADEIPALQVLHDRGRANGVTDLEMVDSQFVRRREPHVAAVAALWSPSTGIVSPEALVRSLLDLCADRDVAVLPSTPLSGGILSASLAEIETGRERIRAKLVVNAAGLFADEVSAGLGGEQLRDLSVPWRIRGAHTLATFAGQWARVSRSAQAWPRPGRPSDTHH